MRDLELRNERCGQEVGVAAAPEQASAASSLLDHVAEELAREFVRLLQEAADEEQPNVSERR